VNPLDGVAPVADVPAAFCTAVAEAYAQRPGPRLTLVLSGGPTARDCYEELAVSGESSGIEWSDVDVYMGDERYVPPADPDANQRLVHEALVDRVEVGSFTPMATTEPIEQCARHYQEVIAAVLAGPGIDLIHLGMGPDGHTASLFPGSPPLEAGPGVLVVPNTDPNEKNPHERLTLTLRAINRARLAVFTVVGPSKRDAVAALARGEDLPAARVAAESVRWLIDPEAMGA
jgi:6-phosphogluconolactonase